MAGRDDPVVCRLWDRLHSIHSLLQAARQDHNEVQLHAKNPLLNLYHGDAYPWDVV